MKFTEFCYDGFVPFNEIFSFGRWLKENTKYNEDSNLSYLEWFRLWTQYSKSLKGNK